MLRILNILLLAGVIGTATWTYTIKHQSEARLAEIARLEKQIETERETIELLKADWAYLSQPARIQALAEKYKDELQLDVVGSTQIIGPQDLPDRPVLDASDGIAEILAGEITDGVTTGSVGEAD